MKSTHNIDYQVQEETDQLVSLISAKDKLAEKTRINLYLPKVVVKLMDLLTNNISRGDLVTQLIVKEVKKKHLLPFGMFSPLEISEKEINDISVSWEKSSGIL